MSNQSSLTPQAKFGILVLTTALILSLVFLRTSIPFFKQTPVAKKEVAPKQTIAPADEENDTIYGPEQRRIQGVDPLSIWQKCVHLKVDYRPVFPGGVRDVAIQFTNNWAYDLDEVAIKIDYVKKNGEVHSSESVTLQQIHPGQTKALSALGAKRGVKAVAYLDRVTSNVGELNYVRAGN
jgi:hypothetical protein